MAKRGREEKAILQRKLARKRFRVLIRSVYLNRLWLSADEEFQKYSLNVKRNIALLVRTQRKIGILTMAEKSLIRSNPAYRSIDDRRKLVTLTVGLQCFAKFTPKVRARLASVIHYMYAMPGRTLIKEEGTPHMVYFILTGEVEVTKKIYDVYNDVYSDKLHFISGPGEIVGEIEMLENCSRRHTYTTTTDVEMLVVFDDDFRRIIYPSMNKIWLDQKRAMKSMSYFNFMNDNQIIQGCKLGTLRQFEPLETIYYEDRGPLTYAHFVISGECIILQCLKMNVTKNKKGVKSYKLVSISKDSADDMFQELTNKEILQALKGDTLVQKETKYDFTTDIESSEDLERDRTKRSLLRRMDIKGIEILCGLRKPSNENFETPKGSIQTMDKDIEHENGNEPRSKEEHENLDNFKKEYSTYDYKSDTGKEAAELETNNSTKNDAKNAITNNEIQKENLDPSKNIENNKSIASIYSKSQASKINISVNYSIPSSASEPTKENSNISVSLKEEATVPENHFIDVGTLGTGAIFGLGEQMEHRVIMARTTVQCLMIPRFWLLEKEQNPGNIWKRRQFYLDCNIPSRESLFQDFLDTNKWQKFKHDFIQNVTNTDSIGNPTKVEDIPVIGRIVEASDE